MKNRWKSAGKGRTPGTGLAATFMLALLTVLTTASSARACAVCFDLADRAREAYYLTTVLMIIVPFALLGGIILWLRKAMHRQAAARMPHSAPGQTPRP